MEARNLARNDVVQINPETARPHAEKFAGQFMVVDEVRDWGVIGYFTQPAGITYYRAQWDDIEYVGRAAFGVLAGDDPDLTRPGHL